MAYPSWTRWIRGFLAALLAFALTPVFASAARAQREDWVLLGTHEVDRGKSRESIDLKGAPGQVRAIRLVAKSGGLDLTKVTITYAGGRAHDEARRINMNPNDRTRPIDPGGQDRFVDSVDLVIQPERVAPGAPRTTLIEVWGLQTPAGARAMRIAVPAAATVGPPPASLSHPVPAPESISPPAPSAARPEPPPPPPPAALPAPRPSDPPADTARIAPAASPPSDPQPKASDPAPAQVLPQGAAPPLPPPRGSDGRPDPRLAMQQQKKSSPSPTPVGKAEKDGTEGIFLGRQPVSPGESGIVQISVGGGRFGRLRLRAIDGPARIERVTVDYASGPAEEIPVNADISANAGSPWISVSGDRTIRQVSVIYGRRSTARVAATVELFGEYVPGYLDPGGEGARDPRHNGWVPLGASTTALRVGADQLDLPVADNKGGFKKLRVDVRDRAITLREVRVVYGTGEDEIIAIDSARQKISAGASFGPIDLRGGTRLVKRIVLKSRARFLDSEARGRDAAIVEVWGQH